MSNSATVSTGYTPRKHQVFIHSNLKRFNVLVCHRRFGKTTATIAEIVDRGLRCTHKNPQYGYIAPTYGAAKRIAWDMIKDSIRDIPGVKFNEAELRIEIQRPWLRDKIKIFLLSAENPGNLRGIYLDGVVLDEYGEMDPTIWGQVIRPALSDRLGWCIFIPCAPRLNWWGAQGMKADRYSQRKKPFLRYKRICQKYN